MTAIRLALAHFTNVQNRHVILCTGSLSALHYKTNTYQTHSFINVYEKIYTLQKQNITIKLMWEAGHVKISGNTDVHSKSKSATAKKQIYDE